MAEVEVIREPAPPIQETKRMSASDAMVKMRAKGVNVFYGDNHAIQNVDLDILRDEVTALIGPSGCGKSTFLRCFNRMNDTIPSCRVSGLITLDDTPIYGDAIDPVQLRARVGMVFQKPNPFPKSVFDNVAYGPKIHGLATRRDELDEIVETSLRRAGLWEEVKDRLEEPGTALSGGQQQRLCIARTIAVNRWISLRRIRTKSRRSSDSGTADSRISSEPRIDASGVLISCAIPADSAPRADSRSSSRSRSNVCWSWRYASDSSSAVRRCCSRSRRMRSISTPATAPMTKKSRISASWFDW